MLKFTLDKKEVLWVGSNSTEDWIYANVGRVYKYQSAPWAFSWIQASCLVAVMTRVACYHLGQICQLQPLLDKRELATVTHAVVTSTLAVSIAPRRHRLRSQTGTPLET